MDYFDTLPNEMLVDICKAMTPEQLVKFTETNKRALEVCQDVLKKKKKEYFEDMYVFKNSRFLQVMEKLREEEKIIPDEYYYVYSHEEHDIDNIPVEHLFLRGNFNHAVLSLQKYLYHYGLGGYNFIDDLITSIESAFEYSIPFEQLYQNLMDELHPNDYTQFYLEKGAPSIIDDPTIIKYKYTDKRFPLVMEELFRLEELDNDYYYLRYDLDFDYFKNVYFKGNFYRAILSLQKFMYQNLDYNIIDHYLEHIEGKFIPEFFEKFIDQITSGSSYVDKVNLKILK